MTETLDRFWRRHPRLLCLTAFALTVLATLVLLSRSDAPIVLYEQF